MATPVGSGSVSQGNREEAILPKPLDPVEYSPDHEMPAILASWCDGSLLVEVGHNNGIYCKDGSSDSGEASGSHAKPKIACTGKVKVPIRAGKTGNSVRRCESCGKEVTVVGLGGLRLDALTHRAQTLVDKHLKESL